jgi:hypothetical protein
VPHGDVGGLVFLSERPLGRELAGDLPGTDPVCEILGDLKVGMLPPVRVDRLVLQSGFVTWLPPFRWRELCEAGCSEPGLVVVPSGSGLVFSSPS